MKAIIYTRVSTKEQSTDRQVNDMKNVSDFEVVKTYSEKISGFSIPIDERPMLQKALAYIKANKIDCMMVSEVSRLGRNTHEVLNLIEALREQSVCIYIHNLSATINKEDSMNEMWTRFFVTLTAGYARMESEQMSYRIRSGIRNRKAKGLITGRKIGSKESVEKFLSKHEDIQKYLSKGYSSREIQKLCKCSPHTIKKVKDYLGVGLDTDQKLFRAFLNRYHVKTTLIWDKYRDDLDAFMLDLGTEIHNYMSLRFTKKEKLMPDNISKPELLKSRLENPRNFFQTYILMIERIDNSNLEWDDVNMIAAQVVSQSPSDILDADHVHSRSISDCMTKVIENLKPK